MSLKVVFYGGFCDYSYWYKITYNYINNLTKWYLTEAKERKESNWKSLLCVNMINDYIYLYLLIGGGFSFLKYVLGLVSFKFDSRIKILMLILL